MQKKFLNRTVLIVNAVLIASLLLSLILQHAWPLFLFSVAVLAIFIPLPAKISSSVSLRFLLSIMLILTLIQIEAVAGYVLKLDLNPLVFNAVNAILVTVLPMLVPNPQRLKWTWGDSWTFLLPVLVVGGLLFSMISLTASNSSDINSAIIHKITTTSDESNHLNMFAQSINSGGDMTISPKSYPTGWHVATAVVTSSFVDLTDKPFMSTVVAYYVMKMFGVFLAVMSVMILLVLLSKQIIKNHRSYLLLFGLVTLFLTLAIIIPNSEVNGFYNFIPQYAYFLLAFTLLINIKGSLKTTLSLLIILIIGSLVSWIISGILLLCIVAVSIAVPLLAKLKPKTQVSIAAIQIATLVLILLAIFLVSLPSGVIGNLIDALEHPEGWIEGINLIAYPVIFLLLIALGLFTAKSNLSLQFRAALISFFAVVGVVFMVTTLRGYGGDQLSYYWQKMLFPLLLIAVSTLVVLAIHKMSETIKHTAAIYIVIVVFMALLATSVLGHRSFDLSLRAIGNQAFLHKTQNLNIAKSLATLFENNKFGSETVDRYVFVTSPNYTLDQMVYQLMSRSITDNSLNIAGETCLPDYNGNGGYYGDNMVLLRNVKSEYCGHKVKIVVSNETIGNVKQYKDEKDTINIDTSF